MDTTQTRTRHFVMNAEQADFKSFAFWSLLVQSVFYGLSGVNHFLNADFYLLLIPPYLPAPELINYGSGVLELVLAVGLYFKVSRTWAALGIMTMLTFFVPAHVYMIQTGGCLADGTCVPLWLAWLRLVAIHPLLMFWAWKHRM